MISLFGDNIVARLAKIPCDRERNCVRTMENITYVL